MSDLSLPPMSLLPLDGGKTSAPVTDERVADRREPFAWPTPPLTSYPVPTCPVEPEPCEVEGLNGRSMSGLLQNFDLDDGSLQLKLPNSRAPLPLRFSQFRSLTLLRPLAPLVGTRRPIDDEVLAARPAVPYRISLRGSAAIEGLTVGHKHHANGIFLFEPIDASGEVRRRFIPRAAYERADVGERIGELLVAQNAASAEDVEAAVREQADLRAQKIGDVLLVRQIVTAEQLEAAIERQARMPMVRIGEALKALGFITQAQLDVALAQQRDDRGLPLGELLVRKGVVSRQDLQAALARKMGYPLVDVTQFPVEADALARVPFVLASRLPALPLMVRAGRVIIALEDPSSGAAIDELEFVAQAKVVPVLAQSSDLAAVIGRAYERVGMGSWLPEQGLNLDLPSEDEAAPDASQLLASLEQQHSAEQRSRSEDESPIEQSDNSLVRLINTMIQEAQAQRVSDIHVECLPGRAKVRIRFRKDGELRPYLELPHTYRSALIARLKIMCDLDISERRKPQDGKINFSRFVPGAKLELRVATIPTHSGLEDAVLRLLASAKPLALDAINLSPVNLDRLKAAVERPYGMVLCVGPTGSGKTTTLHSALGFINKPERKIWTAEDPIEITQPGLRQVQVNPKIDWTFAKALRAFLRADPDVIMVGEIRDQETAQTAIEASLTGHLVLSTLHTNSAPETITRLLDMGMDPFNFSDSLLAVLAQRLVKRLCTDCRTSRPATDDELEELLGDYLHAFSNVENAPSRDDVLAGWTKRFARDGRLMRHASPGCPSCDQTGFKGRTGMHELLSISRGLRQLIQTGARGEEIQRLAIAEGMRTLRQDGIEKVLAGDTTIGEVRATSNT